MGRRKRVVKVTRRGQTTIPAEFRKRHGIKEGSRLLVEDRGGALIVRPIPSLEDQGGSLAGKATLKEALETLRKAREDEVDAAVLERASRKAKSVGLTRKKTRELLDQVKKEAWSRTYGDKKPRQ
jgi:AbrB family looped-hinge helix DNA binding protein